VSQEAFGGENAESYYDEGLTASMTGDLARAVECFEAAIRHDSTMASAYHHLGKCYIRLGKYAHAVGLLTQVAKKRPKLATARIDLGNALTAKGDLEQAKMHFDAVLADKPENAKALLGLASVEFSGGNWAGAVKYAQAALEHSGANYATMFMIGRAAKLTGETEASNKALGKADELINKYLELNEDKPEGHYLRGEVAFVQDDYVTALECFRRAEDRADTKKSYSAYGENFGHTDTLARQAQCYERLDKLDRARELAERIHKVAPDHPVCRALLRP
jgi:tetratricopeptide (TPR) repeat protein